MLTKNNENDRKVEDSDQKGRKIKRLSDERNEKNCSKEVRTNEIEEK